MDADLDIDVAVTGAGLMGAGIAQVFAARGARVRLHDPADAVLAAAPERIATELAATGEDPGAADRVRLCSDLATAVEGAAWVFEAAPEDLELKQAVFASLDALAPADCVLATNTSVMRVTEIAARTQRPERVLGTHWWNPPWLVELVEVVGGERTDAGHLDATIALLETVGKVPVHVRRDVPGFIGNRLQHALWRQAFALVDAGVCDAAAIDTVIRASFGPRLAVLGPMENADLIGLDLTKQIHDYVLPTLDPPSATSTTLSTLVAEGRLGAKTGRGLRAWTPDEAAAARRRLVDHLTGAVPANHQGET